MVLEARIELMSIAYQASALPLSYSRYGRRGWKIHQDSNLEQQRQRLMSYRYSMHLLLWSVWQDSNLYVPPSKGAWTAIASTHCLCLWSLMSDSNWRHFDYKTNALTNWANQAMEFYIWLHILESNQTR